MAHSGGGQLTFRAFCALHETPAQKNSSLGTRQDTRKAKKTLKVTIQRIVEAVVDVEILKALCHDISCDCY